MSCGTCGKKKCTCGGKVSAPVKAAKKVAGQPFTDQRMKCGGPVKKGKK